MVTDGNFAYPLTSCETAGFYSANTNFPSNCGV